MKPGDMLLPNGYLLANKKVHLGIVLRLEERSRLLGPLVHFVLNNGTTHRMDEKTVRDLFDVIPLE